MNRRHGFTLIELLVVIAIIAILAAILFPVFARAREKARQTSCLSNVKQIMLGVRMYLDDFDEVYPLRYQGGGWPNVIQPYLKNTQIYKCPSYDGANGYGACCGGFFRSGTVCRKDAEVVQPAQKIVIWDSTGYIQHYPKCANSGSSCHNGNLDARHNEGVNIGFADGHAKWLKDSEARKTTSAYSATSTL